jgi:ubiquinone/menaquinone biosynthesis C-methylase UbiE
MHERLGRGHDLLAVIFFGGRRHRVYTELARLSGAGSGDRVLDVGCGDGYLTRVMADTVAPGPVLGVDPSREAIARARRVRRRPNCSFVEGRAEALDASDGFYDVVVTSLAIHHLSEALRPQAIHEMLRVVRPGGRLLLAEFRPPTSRVAGRIIRTVTSPAMRHNPVHLLAPMVSKAGFEDVRGGDVRPWICYVVAVKPDGGPERTDQSQTRTVANG